MARVIGEVNPLSVVRLATRPTGACATEQPDQKRHECGHACSNSRIMRQVRRNTVTTQPTAMRARAMGIKGKAIFIHPNTAAIRHAAVITAMRCGFAMGPQNCCEAPAEAPNART